jgi:hypothetical protein
MLLVRQTRIRSKILNGEGKDMNILLVVGYALVVIGNAIIAIARILNQL